MSCALTKDQVRRRIKTETSRDPKTWAKLKPGDPLTLIEQGMGLPKGAKQVVLAKARCTANYLEPLDQITAEAVSREGFPEWSPAQFIEFYCREKGGAPDQMRRVIRWEYVEEVS